MFINLQILGVLGQAFPVFTTYYRMMFLQWKKKKKKTFLSTTKTNVKVKTRFNSMEHAIFFMKNVKVCLDRENRELNWRSLIFRKKFCPLPSTQNQEGGKKWTIKRQDSIKKILLGGTVEMILTGNHEVEDSIPGLSHWIKDLAWLWHRPSLGTSIYCKCNPKKQKKKKKKKSKILLI